MYTNKELVKGAKSYDNVSPNTLFFILIDCVKFQDNHAWHLSYEKFLFTHDNYWLNYYTLPTVSYSTLAL